MTTTALLLAAHLAVLAAFGEPPTVKREAGSLVVTNGAYAATVSAATGALTRLTTAAFGEKTFVAGSMTYSDIGLLAAGSHGYFGTNAVTDATVEVAAESARVVISAEGPLALQDGKQPPGAKWRCRFRYTFDQTPLIHVLAGVQTDTARPAAPGFFATTLNVVGVNEWFADTEDGMRWVDLGPENGRCFAAHNRPLRGDRRRLGLLNHDTGAVVLIDHLEPQPAGTLEDVLFHSSGTGAVTLFLNWVQGASQTAFAPSQWYDLSFDLSLSGEVPK